MNAGKGLDVMEAFYSDSESVEGVTQADGFIQDIQQGLQQSVRAVN